MVNFEEHMLFGLSCISCFGILGEVYVFVFVMSVTFMAFVYHTLGDATKPTGVDPYKNIWAFVALVMNYCCS